MLRTFPLIVALALILSAGAIQGYLSHRWNDPYDFAARAEVMKSIPMQFGDWRGKDANFKAEDYAHAGIRCGLEREYRNRVTGQVVKILIVGGSPGPISVHLPETCYVAAGYEVVGNRVGYEPPVASGQKPSAFWRSRFQQRTQAISHDLVIFYAWNHGEAWQAPEGDARLAFASAPALFKLYVIEEVGMAHQPNSESSAELFLKDALPGLTTALFSGNTTNVAKR